MANSKTKSVRVQMMQMEFEVKSSCCADKTEVRSIEISKEPIVGGHFIIWKRPVCEHVLTQRGKLRKVKFGGSRLSRNKKNIETRIHFTSESIETLTRLLIELKAEQMNMPKDQRTVAFVKNKVASVEAAR